MDELSIHIKVFSVYEHKDCKQASDDFKIEDLTAWIPVIEGLLVKSLVVDDLPVDKTSYAQT